MIAPKITNLGYSNLWTDMSTILGYASNFDHQIQKLFSNGEQGFYYDPNDLSTMFQDAAGTVPVTDVGQPVGLIRDKSGRNNHAFQTNSASRPILRKNAITGANYLEFDGSDDFLRTANINFTSTDKVSLFAGVRKLSDATTGIICELSSNVSNNGAFHLATLATAYTQFTSRGTNSAFNGVVSPSANNYVFSTKAQISTDTSNFRCNGVVAQVSTDQGTGNYGNYPLYIGRRAGTSLPFNGYIYGLIGVGKLVSGNETAAIEKELAKRAGVTLNV